MKKNIKWIIGIIAGVVVASGISVYATGQYFANQINYTTDKNGEISTVAEALNDLYSKKPTGEITNFSGDIYLVGAQSYGNIVFSQKYSYVDINTNNYSNLKIQITYIDENYSTCYVSANETIIQNITGENTYNIDVSEYSKVRIYYEQTYGMDYVLGNYQLSN